tara:strand:+ start:549 stop:956 length:408 start_codon:yes stop_codon:yes gene_type:complete
MFKFFLITLLLVAITLGCSEKIYSIDDLREIGFEDGGEIPITDKSRFSGTYDYIISEGNVMELNKRYPFRMEIMATKFENSNSASEYNEYLKLNSSSTYGAYYKCFINNLYIGIKKDPNYTNYQKICDYIAIDLK